MANYEDLANLIFPSITTTVEDLEKKYPKRNLPEGAMVTRFAPSPTGFLHTGSLFTSLVSSRFAKQSGGVFYIRLEDTDTKREIVGSGESLIEQLAVFDVIPDEGYISDTKEIGNYGPYKQSQRAEIYNTVIKHLIKIGRAYPCFCSAEELNELRKNVGFVFQDADSQIIASDVQGEVSFGPMNLRLPREEVRKRVEEALEYMNITEYRNRPPHYLSGGEKKRVSIADIIAMKSEVVLFDEPTAALDPLSADMLEEVLAKLSAEGKTLLISTHDVDFSYRWAERIVVFCQGNIIADGTPLEIFQEEKVLEQAHLKKPAMFTVYETLAERGLIETGSYPRLPEELKDMLK